MRWVRTTQPLAGVPSGHVQTFSYAGAPSGARAVALRVTASAVVRNPAPGSVSFVLPGDAFRWEAQNAAGDGPLVGFADGVLCPCDIAGAGTLDIAGPTWQEPLAVAEVQFTVDLGYEP